MRRDFAQERAKTLGSSLASLTASSNGAASSSSNGNADADARRQWRQQRELDGDHEELPSGMESSAAALAARKPAYAMVQQDDSSPGTAIQVRADFHHMHVGCCDQVHQQLHSSLCLLWKLRAVAA